MFLFSFVGIVGRNPKVLDIIPFIKRIAPQDRCHNGGGGTGKEVVARALHSFSSNHGDPFVASNCASSVETLIEPRLFGHLKGSFAVAISRQIMNRTMQSLMEGKYPICRCRSLYFWLAAPAPVSSSAHSTALT
jgi:transcriptional regulator of aromatic amino acid metabolism